MPVMPAELRLEMPVSMEMQVMPAERKVEREYEVRLRISEGKMKGITEAPHDTENQKFLEKLDNLSSLSPSRCIYRVPKRLRQGNEKAYTPQVVSIGPLHHGEEHLKAMEEHKKRYLQHFLRRTGVGFSDYIQMIKEQEGRLRGSYAESVEFGSDQFVRIVLVDAAFIIELLLRYYSIKHKVEDDYCQGEDDYIFNNPRMLWDVRPDLRLLENQLPFFILRDLFNTRSYQEPSLLGISYHFFKTQIDSEGKKKNFGKILSSGEEVQHFVDLIRILYRPLDQEKEHTDTDTTNMTATPNVTELDQEKEHTDTTNMTATPNVTELDQEKEHTDTTNMTATPNVTELHQAGVTFKVGKGSSLFDIKFSHCGILKIPKLTVDDTTELTLRNLLAFEQCHRRENDYLANYVFLMKRLVKTREDVQLLVDNGIIDNWLGDTQKISTLLHDLGTGMMVDHHYYARLCGKLIHYRKKCWRGAMVNLRENFFNTPWSTMSVIAAFILLLLTAIQTACSYKSAPLF
ncbi:hypothetical protein C1H46_021933 [Malus baccata]|uniref:Uncharacterized protein n=1 Tax=Malus baccata TaxID=106549 RepID=A0A540M1V8_MALBA|nr:hypothetical protein C1H46_021933 [Malus baccata]